ncbi:hypothetical protein CSW12_02555 [Bacillus cereus]|nr:hypothetical protein CSW12_02265 [Bacillus cereus]AUB62004.1 hypothetical protein CSW12_02555 [Bacillus cereus]
MHEVLGCCIGYSTQRNRGILLFLEGDRHFFIGRVAGATNKKGSCICYIFLIIGGWIQFGFFPFGYTLLGTLPLTLPITNDTYTQQSAR